MKRGILSFVIYTIYTLLGGGTAIYNYIAVQKHNEAGGGFDGLGLAILMIAGIIVFGIGALGLILKSLHMKTGFALFGLLCFALDVACVLVFMYLFLGESGSINDTLVIVGVAIPSMLSALSNLKSMAG